MLKLYSQRKFGECKWDEKRWKRMKERYTGRNIESLNQCGIPEQYGIFLALGVAIIFEGILSACYHICPVKESLQFDTSFMYIMSVLMFIKIYQFRHPDITPNPHLAFSILVVMLIFEAIGYHVPNGVYTFLFIATYMTILFAIIIHLYFQMNIREAIRATWESVSGIKFLGKEAAAKDALRVLKTGGRGRHTFFLAMIVLNVIVAAYTSYQMATQHRPIVSKHLLVIFGINTLGYTGYYFFMKCYYVVRFERACESISWTCWIYIILSKIFVVTSLVFYIWNLSTGNSSISPSESRLLNEECTLGIYDQHDLWHFSSAFAALFIGMVLLTLEDNNTSTPWKKIPVF